MCLQHSSLISKTSTGVHFSLGSGVPKIIMRSFTRTLVRSLLWCCTTNNYTHIKCFHLLLLPEPTVNMHQVHAPSGLLYPDAGGTAHRDAVFAFQAWRRTESDIAVHTHSAWLLFSVCLSCAFFWTSELLWCLGGGDNIQVALPKWVNFFLLCVTNL